ncbi:MAG: endolytic transglycosylase MltG [Candidatus Nealsonbacteria bacterium CG09_land_8_20_14_0_10_42_14]|uniref:Endolytic murein transglycosylase n=1 Tax=Candidatus Nealsonbacteria bacterium CG09_land_8_20_14_0_10_42_14 TaxID=1974707 RepID=A0A2H0WZ55_9BACT|nr:MAG: endolytic transglycosylase MltG [Candidatus Nealsonbacteria bacterium CG09_land_8_20_14_0_10_42_14]
MGRVITLLILIIALVAGAFFLPKDLGSQEEVVFKIEKGEGSKEIAANLEREGLIRWASFFRLYVLTTGVSGRLQAGTYQFSPSMSIFQIAGKLASGDIATVNITIPEGFTAEKIQARVKNMVGLDMPDLEKHEGYLFPDTYKVAYGATGEEIVQMMLNNFDRKTASLAITPDIVIMASLIEKEVQTKEDKEIVSGIFWKRLESGMPLESCATIAYIKGIDQWRYSYEDTRIESPYNTYLNLGLPPGPIANPGLDSIEAALYSQDSDYWYWLSTPEGETIFSKTLAEHNYAKSIYLK